MPGNQISILTYNIHKGFGVGKVRFLLPQMRQELEMLNPDIAFLQEVQGRHDKMQKKVADWPLQSQVDFIGDEGWPYRFYGKNAVYQAGHHGNAMLSKYPLSQLENINISFLPRASRSILHGVLSFQEQAIHLICVHLGLFKEERVKQVGMLAERILEHVPDDGPLILAGDFNDWRKDLSESLEQRLGLMEAIKEVSGQHAKSFPAMSPALQTDRIYFRGLKLVNAECLKGKPWRTLSDHLPLLATFKIEP